MRKVTLLSVILLPTILFAQSEGVSNADFIWNLMTILLVCTIIFFVCREIMCWYWKINKMVANQDEIIRLLKKIAGENNVPTNNTKLKEEKKDVIKELAESARFMITGK